MNYLKGYYSSLTSALVGPTENADEPVAAATTPAEPSAAEQPDTTVPADATTKILDPSSSNPGWLYGVYNNVTSQSGQVWRLVKKDLSEFATVMSTDTRSAVQKTADHLLPHSRGESSNDHGTGSSGLRAGLSRVVQQVSRALYIPPTDDDEGEETFVLREGGRFEPVRDRRLALIQSLANDPATFEPAPDDPDYPTWLTTFDADAHKVNISELLVSSGAVRAQYTRLVPAVILHREFWARYFFRVALVEAEEDRRQRLKCRAKQQTEGSSEDKLIGWEDDELSGDSSCPPDHISPTSALVTTLGGTDEPQSADLVVPTSIPSPDADAPVVAISSNNAVSEVDPPSCIPELLPQEEENVNVGEETAMMTDVRMRERGDLVVVGHMTNDSDQTNTSSGSPNSADLVLISGVATSAQEEGAVPDFVSHSGGAAGQDRDEWDDTEFDVEVTEEDIRMAREVVKKMDQPEGQAGDWEDWS